jgi:maltose operon protein
MKMKTIFVIGLAVLATGCASNKSLLVDYGGENTQGIQKIEPSVGYQALEQASSCCDSLSELNYQTITNAGKFDFIIDVENPSFNFSTGKSFVKGVQLPEADGIIKVVISAPIITSVFVPSVLVLDAQYQPLKIYNEDTISYDNASLLSMNRFFGNIKIPKKYSDGTQAKYLLIFTTKQAMQGTTKLTLPDASAAESGRADVAYQMYMDKAVKHTAIGSVRLAFDYKLNTSDAAKDTIPALVVVRATKNISHIQPETEAMFLKLIEQAVVDGEYDKAKIFVEEAEKSGSNKAKDALKQALKEHK